MKRLNFTTKLFPLLLLSILLISNSCIKGLFDLDDDLVEDKGELVLEAKVNGKKFKGYNPSASLEKLEGGNYSFTLVIADGISSVLDALKVNWIGLIIAGDDFSKISKGDVFTSKSNEELLYDNQFVGVYMHGSILNIESYFDAFALANESGKFTITHIDTVKKTIAGDFSFVGYDIDTDAKYEVKSGELLEIEYKVKN